MVVPCLSAGIRQLICQNRSRCTSQSRTYAMLVSNCLPIENATKSDNKPYCNFGLELIKPIKATRIRLDPSINGRVKRSAEKCNCGSMPTSQNDPPANNHAPNPSRNISLTQTGSDRSGVLK